MRENIFYAKKNHVRFKSSADVNNYYPMLYLYNNSYLDMNSGRIERLLHKEVMEVSDVEKIIRQYNMNKSLTKSDNGNELTIECYNDNHNRFDIDALNFYKLDNLSDSLSNREIVTVLFDDDTSVYYDYVNNINICRSDNHKIELFESINYKFINVYKIDNFILFDDLITSVNSDGIGYDFTIINDVDEFIKNSRKEIIDELLNRVNNIKFTKEFYESKDLIEGNDGILVKYEEEMNE